jgi:predicted acylesterase/phospholipase RssA
MPAETGNEIDIQTSEFGYYLIAELITMPDRILAQKIELSIWNKCPIPSEPILCKVIEFLKESEGPEEFYEAASKYIESLPIEWTVTENKNVMRRDKI